MATVADAYSEKARSNILPLSRGAAFPAVFDEWRVSGEVRDYGSGVADCGLCDQERLRYHFRIDNRYTSKTLWVGSRCILRFGVAVYEGTRRLTGSQAERKLNELIEDARQRACLKALREVARKEANDILTNAISYFQEHGSLSPRLAFVVLWRLREHGIDHNPLLFKVNLRRQKYMRDLEEMPANKVRLLWPALSASQRKKAKEAGVAAPADV
jgi:hypothetical protein